MTSDDLAKEMYEALKKAERFISGIELPFVETDIGFEVRSAIHKYELAHTIPLEDEK